MGPMIRGAPGSRLRVQARAAFASCASEGLPFLLAPSDLPECAGEECANCLHEEALGTPDLRFRQAMVRHVADTGPNVPRVEWDRALSTSALVCYAVASAVTWVPKDTTGHGEDEALLQLWEGPEPEVQRGDISCAQSRLSVFFADWAARLSQLEAQKRSLLQDSFQIRPCFVSPQSQPGPALGVRQSTM